MCGGDVGGTQAKVLTFLPRPVRPDKVSLPVLLDASKPSKTPKRFMLVWVLMLFKIA